MNNIDLICAEHIDGSTVKIELTAKESGSFWLDVSYTHVEITPMDGHGTPSGPKISVAVSESGEKVVVRDPTKNYGYKTRNVTSKKD